MIEVRGNFKGNKNLPENCPLFVMNMTYTTTEHILTCKTNEEQFENMDLKD